LVSLAALGITVEGVFLVFFLPSSSVWISEWVLVSSCFSLRFLPLVRGTSLFLFLSRDEGVCLYISVGVFRLFLLPFLPQTRVPSGLLQSIDLIPSCLLLHVYSSFGLSEVCSASPCSLNILISFPNRTEVNPTLLVCMMDIGSC
jgi:hypothetical protein